MIYLDHPATSWPKPPEVLTAMAAVLEKAGGNPGQEVTTMRQKTQTELFDGFSVNISQGSLNANKDLVNQAEADMTQKSNEQAPDFKIITPISDTNGIISCKT